MEVKYIHVAGTNGKGSVCEFIANSLISGGKKTGKFTSPHVLDITERITVNNIPISHLELERLCGIIDCPQETPQFELLMNAALLYFRGNNVEYAVIETGIGGLLDCTNTITPIVSVITKIGYDHTSLLGDTIERIAGHKAGIIKAGVPVVTDPTQSEGAMGVIRETAALMNSRLIIPALNQRFDLKMMGEHQAYNAMVAAETLKLIGVSPDFTGVQLPARMQVVEKNPLFIVDGAHNPDAVRSVLSSLKGRKITVVFGMVKSKDYHACVKELSKADTIILTDGFSPNAVPCSEFGLDDAYCVNETSRAVDLARELSGYDGIILVCGSLYLAGEVLGLFNNIN